MVGTKPEYKLYNVKKDTLQLHNIADSNPNLIIEFKKIIEKWGQKHMGT